MGECLPSDENDKGAGSSQGAKYQVAPISCPWGGEGEQQRKEAEERRGPKQRHRNQLGHVGKRRGSVRAAKTRRAGAGVWRRIFLLGAWAPDHGGSDAAHNRHDSSQQDDDYCPTSQAFYAHALD